MRKPQATTKQMFCDEDYVTALEHGSPPTAVWRQTTEVVMLSPQPHHPRRDPLPGNASAEIIASCALQKNPACRVFLCLT